MHFVDNTRDFATAVETKDITYHFGMFIGRSNQHRLNLASHLYNKHKDKTIQTYHYDPTIDFHKNNVGLEDLLTAHQSSIVDVTKLIADCPITLDQVVTCPILMDQHLKITEKYKSFFVEIACETYY